MGADCATVKVKSKGLQRVRAVLSSEGSLLREVAFARVSQRGWGRAVFQAEGAALERHWAREHTRVFREAWEG